MGYGETGSTKDKNQRKYITKWKGTNRIRENKTNLSYTNNLLFNFILIYLEDKQIKVN